MSGDGKESNPATHDPESLFAGSLAPHLGLNCFRDLDWQGLVVDDAENIGKAIVNEARKQQIDLIVMRSVEGRAPLCCLVRLRRLSVALLPAQFW